MPTNSLSRLFFSTSGNIGNAGCRSWSRAKLAFGIAFAGMAMTAGQARAVVVNVGGQDWDVTQFHGNYHTNAIPFQTPANGGVVPWMGSASFTARSALPVSALNRWIRSCQTMPPNASVWAPAR
jgi:hypothetical protein